MGSLRDVGISDSFIRDVREKITPGTSALFVLTSDAVLYRVASEFRGSTGEIIHTNVAGGGSPTARRIRRRLENRPALD